MKKSLLTAALCFLSNIALADHITVSDAWARATPPGAQTGAIYLTLTNQGAADRLVALGTDAAREAQLHTHLHADGMMRMEQIAALELPANGTAVMAPGGDHVMLIGLKQPLVPGATVTLTLEFAQHEALSVSIPVRDGRR